MQRKSSVFRHIFMVNQSTTFRLFFRTFTELLLYQRLESLPEAYLILANHLAWKNHFWQICSHRHSNVLMQGCVHPCAEDRLFHGEDSVKRKSRFHILRLRCSFLVSETNFGAHNLSFFLEITHFTFFFFFFL